MDNDNNRLDSVGKQDHYLIPQASAENKTILDLLDSRVGIQELLHSLAGEVKDNNTGMWVQQILGHNEAGEALYMPPKVNKLGIEAIRLELQRVGKDVYLSNLDMREIGDIMLTLNFNLSTLFFFRWKDFGIHPKDISNVHWLIMDKIYISFKRAFGEGERKFLKKPLSYTETQNISQNQPQQQGGFKI